MIRRCVLWHLIRVYIKIPICPNILGYYGTFTVTALDLQRINYFHIYIAMLSFIQKIVNFFAVFLRIVQDSIVSGFCNFPLRKQAYSNILKNLAPTDKNSDICHISAQNTDCGYSLEPVPTSTHTLCF